MSEGYSELIEIFKNVEQEMLGAIGQANVIPHNPTKGSAIEEIFMNFLKTRLPRSLDVSSGIIVDSNGRVSKQIDVIIFDSLKTPIFFKNKDTQIIPVECVYAVIEVKKKIGSEDELQKIIKNMESVRSLEKKAYFSSDGAIKYTNTLYGKKWDYWPMQYYVFALDSMNLKTLKEKIEKDVSDNNRPPEKRLDVVCVLKKGLILNVGENGGWNALPDENSKLDAVESGPILLRFYGLTMPVFTQMTMKPFRILDYISKIDS